MILTKSDRINDLLYEMNIHSPMDVILYFPRKYEDFHPTALEGMKDKALVVLYGVISQKPYNYTNAKNQQITKFGIKDQFGILRNVIAYNREYISLGFKVGDEIAISGYFYSKTNSIVLINIFKAKAFETTYFRPIYKLPATYQSFQFTKLVKNCFLREKDRIFNIVPTVLRKKHHLIDKQQALMFAHFPNSEVEMNAGLRHLKYEEALMFYLRNALIKDENSSLIKTNNKFIKEEDCLDFINNLPFKLTNDQETASKEILQDMNKDALMYRLLQGDVGSGKTVVSFITLYANYLRNKQGTLMAPTEALAKQHFKTAQLYFKNSGVNICLLTRSISVKQRKVLIQDIKDGKYDLIIGTHTLFSQDVDYKDLGLVVIDEQHRFGVNQRSKLANKGDSADVLMMSATPIPRSLALTIYGDLDISSISSFPTQRKNIKTLIYKSSYDVEKDIKETIKQGRQVYIIAPVVYDRKTKRTSIESLMDSMKDKDYSFGYLYSSLSQKRKDEVLNDFVENKIQVLVSTSLVEVGIDIPNASLMIIYSANTFGLASLHQLRGRIGRDGYPSKCILLNDSNDEEEKEKLNILANSLDGFYIAEEDLKLRGPGQLNGLKQSGVPEFKLLNPFQDIKIFQAARKDVEVIINDKNNDCYKYILNQCQEKHNA